MALKDIIVFFLYILGNVAISVYLGRKINNSTDYFAAGNQSSWWLSGLSAFMTMFSAGTFVVWGGIAFKAGFVAVTISMCLGISALFVGHYLAGKWRKLGVSSAAEFINFRYGKWALNVYTWFNILYRLLGMAVALYSLAVVLEAIIPTNWNQLFINHIGLSAVNTIIVFCGVIIVLYTIFGGLWAVLLTDVLQFVILMVAVISVIPLGFIKMGGVNVFLNGLPDHFFNPVNQEFTWVFMAAWVVIHMFKIGGEWAFVQRFICVTNNKEAKKATYLFGVLYLVSPVIWMLPPMMYRVVDSSANFEQAYVLACKYALPEGLLGLMIASMFAATVSMIDSELNVYAGVLTKDFYKRIFKEASEKSQVLVGRLLTLILGALVTFLAILIPKLGGAEDIVLSITALVAGVTVLPVIWGMFSSRINEKGVFVAIMVSTVMLILIKYGLLIQNGWFVSKNTSAFVEWLKTYNRTIEAVSGVIVPIVVLTLVEISIKTQSPKFIKIDHVEESNIKLEPSLFPGKIMAVAIMILAFIVMMLAITAETNIVSQWILFSTLIFISVVIWFSIRRIEIKRNIE
ncbi:sodium:solute symporter family protein [Aestuariibaculum suncheonense]|uniref:Na+:solute symporter n=1 Tax=Aestuariibaculum suncheonense TaxID=1028745 RepID=A0A8J6U9J6_9FLAO|nr:sodium:solute symporter family protein [Aestuariibaculum suncheonense]MBD0833925.1 Na+:solute symporter [Aestuariibaculum suncheonense]